MSIKPDIAFIWPLDPADIPAPWEVIPEMYGRYAKAWSDDEDPNVEGGAPMHEHSSPAHTHFLNSHTHFLTIGSAVGSVVDSGGGSGGAKQDHIHAGLSSGVMQNQLIGNISAVYSEVSNDPPYVTVHFIRPTVAVSGLPSGAIALYDNADFLNNTGKYKDWYLMDGAEGRANFHNRYLKGALDGISGGSFGGSLSNTHVIEHDLGHAVQHNHGSVVTGGANVQNDRTGGSDMASADQTHTVTPNIHYINTSDDPTILMDETVEPAYIKLLAIQNNSLFNRKVKGMIGLWNLAVAEIPKYWRLLDGQDGALDARGRHIKITTDVSEIGDIGGSNVHSHAEKSHGHDLGTHTHTVPNLTGGNNTRHDGNSQGGVSNHIHPVTADSQPLFLLSNTTTGDESSNEPEYTTFALIQYVGSNKGGAGLLLELN